MPPVTDNKPQTSTTETAAGIGALAVKNADRQLVEPGERVVTVIRRHIIGVVAIYIEMLAGIATLVVVAILAMSGVFGDLPSDDNGLIAAATVLICGFIVALLLISTYVYRQCRIIVTDKSLVAIIQKALFSRKVSRLSMSNVEDVTAEQRGLLPTIFNYGTLTVQTAGEEDNFIFTMCPKPNDVADQVLQARQAYVKASAD